MLFKVLTLSRLTFSDGIRGRLKALSSTELKVETANRQSSNRVRTLHVDFEVPFNSQVGYVAQHARSRLDMQATAFFYIPLSIP